jgi:hypothetical protein
MRKRLVAFVVVAGALAFGPAAAASATTTPTQVQAQTGVAVTAVSFNPPGMVPLGRYWS